MVTNRVIQNIFTKGTFNDTSKESYEPQYVLAISRNFAEDKNNIGICYFDISTFVCFLGSFEDDQSYSTLRTALSKIRPVEIVYDQTNLCKEIELML